MSDLYTLPVRTLAGKDTDLSAYKGHVLLIVNTASQCGFTPHYAGLETLYRQYKDQGLVVLGFPCNQFGAQEPGSAADIAAFCEKNYPKNHSCDNCNSFYLRISKTFFPPKNLQFRGL